MPSIDDILAEVDKWFAERLQRPPIAHHVEAYNQAHAARLDLKDRLTALITGKVPEAAAEAARTSDEAQGGDPDHSASSKSTSKPTA